MVWTTKALGMVQATANQQSIEYNNGNLTPRIRKDNRQHIDSKTTSSTTVLGNAGDICKKQNVLLIDLPSPSWCHGGWKQRGIAITHIVGMDPSQLLNKRLMNILQNQLVDFFYKHPAFGTRLQPIHMSAVLLWTVRCSRLWQTSIWIEGCPESRTRIDFGDHRRE